MDLCSPRRGRPPGHPRGLAVHHRIQVFAPWLLLGGAELAGAAHLVPPVPAHLYLLLCAAATAVTVASILGRRVDGAVAKAPVAEAMRYGYLLAQEHCHEDHAHEHRVAVGETATLPPPVLQLVQPPVNVGGPMGGAAASAVAHMAPRRVRSARRSGRAAHRR